MNARQLGWLKVAVFVAALLPFVRLVSFAALDRLGANPIEFITRNTGSWALYLLCTTLAMTPLRAITAWTWPLRLRRMLGLFSFFYASLHFLAFLWFDHFFDLTAMWADVLKRPFIAMGFTAFVLLIPLAATSNRAAIARLGRNWQRLHRLVYVIAPLALLHFWWMRAGKNDFAEPALFAVIVAVLLLLRLPLLRARWRIQPGGSTDSSANSSAGSSRRRI